MSAASATTKVKTHTSSRVRSSPKYSLAARIEGPSFKESAPGPGIYGIPSVSPTVRRSQSWSFASSTRASNRKFAGSGEPGPGAYSVHDHEPFKFIQKTVMGTDARMPDKRVSAVPPPGTYPKKSTLGEQGITILGRHEVTPASTTPAPGSYTPSFTQVHKKPPLPHVDTREDREKADTFKTKSWKSGAPDPGYLGATRIMSRTEPSFSLGSRRRPAKSDSMAGPGPVLTDYSVFHR